MLYQMLQDGRYAVRVLRKAPRFAIVGAGGYDTAAKHRAVYDQVLERARALPGVRPSSSRGSLRCSPALQAPAWSPRSASWC